MREVILSRLSSSFILFSILQAHLQGHPSIYRSKVIMVCHLDCYPQFCSCCLFSRCRTQWMADCISTFGRRRVFSDLLWSQRYTVGFWFGIMDIDLLYFQVLRICRYMDLGPQGETTLLFTSVSSHRHCLLHVDWSAISQSMVEVCGFTQ